MYVKALKVESTEVFCCGRIPSKGTNSYPIFTLVVKGALSLLSKSIMHLLEMAVFCLVAVACLE